MPNYPALYECATQELHPLAGTKAFTIGRSPRVDLPVADPECSPQHFRILVEKGVYYVETLNSGRPVCCNGQAVQARLPLRHGAVLRAGSSQFRFLSRPEAASDRDRTVFGPSLPGEIREVEGEIPLTGSLVLGRDPQECQIHLPHVRVSRRHAQIALEGTTAQLTDLRSANGTFVNGRSIAGTVTLHPGDRIDIGPYALAFTGRSLISQSRENNTQLVCCGLRCTVPDRSTGGELVLLDDVTLVIRPRELVCLLGPSGCGKSTLLSAMTAQVPANSGSVLLNREDLYAHFDALKQNLAVVPQREALHDRLTVEEALSFTARLRLPPDSSDAEIQDCVADILQTVGLSERRSTPIGRLSGGQLKRASLANEILAQPSLLFLDEVTSGLDEQTDREMMALFRQLADAGKTVVCVTHSLQNVERSCHLIVILAAGGKLAFVGTPAEALEYFHISRLGDVYDCLAEKAHDEWKAAFLQSPLHKRNVIGRLPASMDGQAVPPDRTPPSWAEQWAVFRRQWLALTQRYTAILLADRKALVMLAAQVGLVAALLILLFGNLEDQPLAFQVESSHKLLFLTGLFCLWFGCNNAAKEIVKERVIYQRERNVNLLVPAYYASKVGLLSLITFTQATLLFAAVGRLAGLPGDSWCQWLVLLLLSSAGITLGLLISAAARTEDQAITLVPIVLMPQIILAGFIAPLNNGIARLLAQGLVTDYWGFRALRALLPGHFHPDPAAAPGSAWEAAAVVLAHVVVLAVLGIAVLYIQDRRSSYGRAIDQWLAQAKVRVRNGLSPAAAPAGDGEDF
jgi:ABC-type multidrug transport system ATPase subunit/pSer/pThr/pTyr-binding forkhead associated (FHA) protein